MLHVILENKKLFIDQSTDDVKGVELCMTCKFVHWVWKLHSYMFILIPRWMISNCALRS